MAFVLFGSPSFLSLVPTLRTSEAASELSCKTHCVMLRAASFQLFFSPQIAFYRISAPFANSISLHAKFRTIHMQKSYSVVKVQILRKLELPRQSYRAFDRSRRAWLFDLFHMNGKPFGPQDDGLNPVYRDYLIHSTLLQELRLLGDFES